MDLFWGLSEKDQGLSIFRGHRPGACIWKIFSWSPTIVTHSGSRGTYTLV